MPQDGLHFSTHDLYTLFGVLVAAFILKLVLKRLYTAFLGPLSKIPGPVFSALSEIPSLLRLIRGERFKWLQSELHPKYGKIIRIAPASVVVMDRDAVKLILISEDLPKHPCYETLAMSDKQTLFSAANRTVYKQRRRILSPAFSMQYISSIEPFIQSCLQDLLEKLHTTLQQFPSTNGTVVNIYELINSLTLDIIGSTAFGGSFNLVRTGSHLLPQKVKEELAYRINTSQFSFLKLFLKRDDYLFEFVTRIIKERRKQTGEMRKDILQFMIDARDENGDPSMTNLEIYDQLFEFIIAGSDTTSFCMYNLIRFLVTTPDKKKCLVEELDAELHNCSPGEIPNETLKSMPYLNACISESMRLRPTALDGANRIADNDIIICDHLIPKGTTVIPNIYELHRSTEYWGEDALEFKPERWLDKENIPHNCYYPFSAGSRKCIGIDFALQEMRIITASLFKDFNLECVPGQLEDIRNLVTANLKNSTYYVHISAKTT